MALPSLSLALCDITLVSLCPEAGHRGFNSVTDSLVKEHLKLMPGTVKAMLQDLGRNDEEMDSLVPLWNVKAGIVK